MQVIRFKTVSTQCRNFAAVRGRFYSFVNPLPKLGYSAKECDVTTTF